MTRARRTGAPARARARAVSGLLLLGAATVLVAAAAERARADAPTCQAAIERGGVRLARRLWQAVEACAGSGGPSLTACLDGPDVRGALDTAAKRWRTRVLRACAGVDVHSELGYLDTCGPAESACPFSSAVVDAAGTQNDLVDCLACKVESRLRSVGVALFADRPAAEPCRRAVAGIGWQVLATRLSELDRCLRGRAALSIAGCLSDPDRRERLAAAGLAWRDAAERACSGVDPFTELGYPALCTGVEPAVPAFCADEAPPCSFAPATRLTSPGADNDLFDCVECRVDEGVLGVARDLFGANLCCDVDGCSVRTRRSCRADAGHPVFHRVDVRPGIFAGFPHDTVIDADGTLWVPDRRNIGIWRAEPDLPATFTSLDDPSLDGIVSPDGLVLDTDDQPIITYREQNLIRRLEADGTTTPYALNGLPGHSGDGGPALAARAAAPMGIDFDSRGNLYFTESGLLAFAFQGASATGEFIRVIDPLGTIRTVAGGSGAGGPDVTPPLLIPYGLAVRSDASILIGEAGGNRLLELDPGGRLIHRAGRFLGVVGAYSGDGGPAIDARFYGIESVVVDRHGNALIGDFRNGHVRLIDRLGSVISILGRDDGRGRFLPLTDGVPASQVWGGCPGGLAIGADGRIYVADGQLEVVRVLTETPY